MVDFPVVYSSSERNFNGLGLAVLGEAQNIKIRQVINGDYTLAFAMPRISEKWAVIKEEAIVFVCGQAFRIRTFDEVRDSTGRLISNIQCEHISYDLNDVKHIPDMRDIVNVSPMQVFWDGFTNEAGTGISGVLRGTSFTFQSEISGTCDLFLSKCSPRAVLNEFLNKLECEAIFDNFNITLVAKRGNANGVQFRVGKNIQTVKRKTDSTGLCTRLYPYGKDYLDITSVNANNLPYIDSPIAGVYDYMHEDFRDYPDITTPADLKTRALKEWSTTEKDGIDKPKVTYEVSIVELKKLGNIPFENFSLGDTVTIIDEGLNINVNARIMEYEYYPFEPNKSNVVLANFTENIGGVFAELLKAKNIVSDLTNNRGEVRDNYIESVHDTLNMRFNVALTKKTVVYDYANMWVDDMKNPTSAIALVNGMFALSNGKSADGSWNWRTIGDANGLVADSVVSGWVYAGKVTTSQLQAGTINTSLINLSSSNGNLKITSDKININSNDESQVIISPSVGVRVVYEKDTQGRPLKQVTMDASGIHRDYLVYNTPTGGWDDWFQYNLPVSVISGLYSGSLNSSTPFEMLFDGPAFADSGFTTNVMVYPAETLRFARPDGGHVGDVTEYKCAVRSVTRGTAGTTVLVDSYKTYVSSISNNSPVLTTGRLQFNMLVILQ